MSIRQDLIENGYDPDAPNTRGYECRLCGYVPTEYELDSGYRKCCNKSHTNEEAKA